MCVWPTTHGAAWQVATHGRADECWLRLHHQRPAEEGEMGGQGRGTSKCISVCRGIFDEYEQQSQAG